MSADYDDLSEPGRRQSRLLGEHWTDTGVTLDAVYVGPRRRQQQTLEIVAEVYRERRLALPDALPLEDLDEHHGLAVVLRSSEVLAAARRGESPPLQELLATFKRVTRQWVRKELVHEDIESWRAFRARVGRALGTMTSAHAAHGKTVAAFTSAGAIAAAVGQALDVDDEKVLDLSWSLYNASVSELAFSETGCGMRTFNATPHLRDPSLVTSV